MTGPPPKPAGLVLSSLSPGLLWLELNCFLIGGGRGLYHIGGAAGEKRKVTE